jgi:signal transduction histidine kinase
MVSTRRQPADDGRENPEYPAARFVTDFTRLITDVDRLMVDIRSATETESIGGKVNGRPRKHSLNDTISSLRDHARLFVKSLGNDGAPSLHELVVSLSRAYTLRSVADIVGHYCRKAFGSPAGMIFVERDGDLQLISKWHSRQIPKKYFAEEIVRNGPVTSAFRAGAPMFWSPRRNSGSKISRYVRDLFPQFRNRSVAFLPIRGLDQRALGVLIIFLPTQDEVAADVRDEILRLGQIVSGCIVRARAYDEALDARARAEHAYQRKEEFLSVLSHELRNPMMPILGWAVALGSGTLPAERQNLAIDGIVRNVRALNYLIDDLFDAARISSGKLRLELVETRIQEVAREALTAIQHAAENKKLRISTDISEAIPPFFADSRRLRQVLMNLLSNALKFTPAGGSIRLKIVRRRGVMQCTVKDTGKGIDAKFLPFVFEPFRQENRSAKSKSPGLGLGLAIVREIVTLHGGTIKAYSAGADRGATFVLRLPIATRKENAKWKQKHQPL